MNIWLLVGEGKLVVKLVYLDDVKKSIVGMSGEDWSGVFVIGYRWVGEWFVFLFDRIFLIRLSCCYSVCWEKYL